MSHYLKLIKNLLKYPTEKVKEIEPILDVDISIELS